MGPSSAKVEKATFGGQGSSSTEGGSSSSLSRKADLLRTCVPVFITTPPHTTAFFVLPFCTPVNTVSGELLC